MLSFSYSLTNYFFHVLDIFIYLSIRGGGGGGRRRRPRISQSDRRILILEVFRIAFKGILLIHFQVLQLRRFENDFFVFGLPVYLLRISY